MTAVLAHLCINADRLVSSQQISSSQPMLLFHSNSVETILLYTFVVVLLNIYIYCYYIVAILSILLLFIEPGNFSYPPHTWTEQHTDIPMNDTNIFYVFSETSELCCVCTFLKPPSKRIWYYFASSQTILYV